MIIKLIKSWLTPYTERVIKCNSCNKRIKIKDSVIPNTGEWNESEALCINCWENNLNKT